MTKISLIAAAVLLAAGAAHAQTKSHNGMYGELGYAFLNVKGGGETLNPGALRGIYGWEVQQYLSLEAMLALGAGDDTTFDGYKVKVTRSYGIFLTPKYDIGRFEIFGRLGYADSRVKVSGFGGSGSTSDGSFAWGLGGKYHFHKSFYGSVDYMQYYKKDDLKVDGVTLGVGYNF